MFFFSTPHPNNKGEVGKPPPKPTREWGLGGGVKHTVAMYTYVHTYVYIYTRTYNVQLMCPDALDKAPGPDASGWYDMSERVRPRRVVKIPL